MSATATVIDLASYRRSRQQAAVAQPAPASLPLVPIMFVTWWFMPVVLAPGYT